jgi:hypothetical protein
VPVAFALLGMRGGLVAVEANEYKWYVRKGNTARLAVEYRELDGTIIPTTGAVGTLYVYDGATIVLQVTAVNDGPNGRFSLFISKAEILAFDFRQAEYEFNVVFPNIPEDDETTLVDGPLIVESGRGPFA